MRISDWSSDVCSSDLVALTRIPAPSLPEGGIMRLTRLYRTSPLGFVGAAVTGVMMGAFYGLGAVFARGVGLNTAGTAVFMSATILGGVALQWPLGRLSDLVDRRRVIVGTFLATDRKSRRLNSRH